MVLLHLLELIGEIECFCPFTSYSHLPKTSAFLYLTLESSFSMSFYPKTQSEIFKILVSHFFSDISLLKWLFPERFNLVKRNLRQITWISTSVYFLWDILTGFVAKNMVSITTAQMTSGFSQRRTISKSASDY